jgi:hypothetical protein
MGGRIWYCVENGTEFVVTCKGNYINRRQLKVI